MKSQMLPIDAASILALTWSDYEPLYKELESRLLENETETLNSAANLLEEVIQEMEAKL
jgi:hypothetical protein